MRTMTRFASLLTTAALIATTANAAVTFDLTKDSTGGNNLPTSTIFGTLSLTLANSQAASITVTANPGYKTGGDTGGTLDFNIYFNANASSIGFGLFSGTGGTGAFGVWSDTGSWPGYSIISTSGGYAGSYNSISFVLQNSSGTWASENDVLEGGTQVRAYFFATADSGTTQGFASGNVPEPSTFALVALGAAGLHIFRRRKG